MPLLLFCPTVLKENLSRDAASVNDASGTADPKSSRQQGVVRVTVGRMRAAAVVCAVSLAALAAGCATITVGRYQKVDVLSSPAGAQACVEEQCVTTPGTLTLKRNSHYTVRIEMAGYVSETAALTSRVGPAALGNLVVGRVIGFTVDAASGALYKLYPESVNVTLKPNGPASLPAEENNSHPAGEKSE